MMGRLGLQAIAIESAPTATNEDRTSANQTRLWPLAHWLLESRRTTISTGTCGLLDSALGRRYGAPCLLDFFSLRY
jgi:hypothetical protein